MRTILTAVLVAVTPVLVAAQTNTTGTLSPNTGVTQGQPTTPSVATGGASGATPATTAAPTPVPARERPAVQPAAAVHARALTTARSQSAPSAARYSASV